MKLWNVLLAIGCSLIVASCGGGGSATTNVAPIANAGAAQDVFIGSVVTLDGSASSDANGDPLTYAWTLTAKPSGSAANLSSVTATKPTFLADVAGTYIATLVVNDGKANSGSGTVSITATAPAVTRFVKLDNSGNMVPASATGWSCVLDTTQGGLMWEVKTGDGGLRGMDWVYTSYSSIGTNGNGVCDSTKTCNVFNFRDAVNAVGLCGYKDWRLPNVYELEGLRDRNQSQTPYIDTQYFPFTKSAPYWCDDGSWSTGSPYIWVVDFSEPRYSYSTRFRDFQYHVRLVRTLTR